MDAFDACPFDGGVFKNDPKTGRHVTAVAHDTTAAGFRVYRVVLDREYEPVVTVDAPAVIVVKDVMDWHPQGCTVTFDDGCDMTAVVPTNGRVSEVLVVRWRTI